MPSLRERFMAGQLLFGSFIKTPTTHSIEILGAVGFDFVVIDEEHAPFDRAAIDVAIIAAQAAGISPMVRVADATPSRILSVLDSGATGILVPHVVDAATADAVAGSARFSGRRGYSGSTRSAGFGAQGGLKDALASDAETLVIAQIEDRLGVDNAPAILATAGIDGVFIGRADLALALGAADSQAPEVMIATEQVAAAARIAGKPVAAFAASAAEAQLLHRLGATLIVLGSDQTFLRRAATAELNALREGTSRQPNATRIPLS